MNKNNLTVYAGTQNTLFMLAFSFVLVVNGAMPFFAMPTTGQAFWATGFSQSFANEGFFAIYAHNFGAPKSAAMAFGLAGAWVAGVFIRLGIHAADAYALMMALWLSIAFLGAYKLSRFMDVSPRLSILAALVWGTMPMVWNHANYSMLSTGIALLPFYFWTTLNFFQVNEVEKNGASRWTRFFLYLSACVISIFMDGYSFMMFAVGASIIGMVLILKRLSNIQIIFAHCTCFGLAYLLFALYIGKNQFEPANLDFFRGWGADLSFFIIPSSGVHWIPDILGWSKSRGMNEYFGDGSVWVTTFCLPLLLGALSLSLFAKSKYRMAFIAIAFFGFYMSLGPSFKYYSTKPNPGISDLMDPQYALAPTGTAFISENIPGFRNMRASYRWAALGCFGTWGLIVLAMSNRRPKGVILAAAGTLVVVTVLNVPDLPKQLERYKSHRVQFMGVDKDLLMGMKEILKPGEKVAFLPWRNDFLVNYLAAKLDIVAYNVGGDKNYQEARKYWPATLATIPMGAIQDELAAQVSNLLTQGDANAVVLPYIDMLWAAHEWPHPAKYKDEIESKIIELDKLEYFEVVHKDYYSLVRLRDGFLSDEKRKEISVNLASSYCSPPICLSRSNFTTGTSSQTGVVENGQLVANGKAGFLHYGPYQFLNKGSYYLTVRGVANGANGAWIDVVSQRGKVDHGKFYMGDSRSEMDGVLVSAPINLPNAVEDIEIRIYVGDKDQLTLSGYELRPRISNGKP